VVGIGRLGLWAAVAVMVTSTRAVAYEEENPDVLRVGHWVEVRGEVTGDRQFKATRIELLEPDRYEVLLGTIDKLVGKRAFNIMGMSVELNDKTTYREIAPDHLEGQRVKLQGYYLGDSQFTSRKIYARNPGRDGISGRVDSMRKVGDGFEITIMDYRVSIAPHIDVRREKALVDYAISPPRALAVVDRNRDEEDLFGAGFWLTESLFLSGQLEAIGLLEDDFDINDDVPRKQDEALARARARFVYQPADYFFAVATFSYVKLWRDDQRRGRLEREDYRMGESYLYFLDPWNKGLSLQLGRVDFDERREWLYDQDLDTVRLILERGLFRAELSYSETLFDGSPIDEAARNTIIYLSNRDADRHVAGYVIHRDYDLAIRARQTNYGFRAFGEWLPDHDSWLEIGFMQGNTGRVDARGWAVDVGTTWEVRKNFFVTGGFALGQGDDRDTRVNETFRQTGLHDNNDKFGGVTSFRYYGELVDPELANMQIVTLGLGWRPMKRVSLDLVWHEYRQHRASRLLVDTQLKARPNGIDKGLGQEFDLILGWRTSRTWDLEVIAAWFDPGKAFFNQDPALMGKIQFRYRF